MGLFSGVRASIRRYVRFSQTKTVEYDYGTTDYEFWDLVRRGRARGLELSGLLLKPLVSKISGWSLSDPPIVSVPDDDYTAKFIQNWLEQNIQGLSKCYEESLFLGDSYIVVNPDTTLTIVHPSTVTPIVEPTDYSKIRGWKIKQKFSNPESVADYMIITEEFYKKRRVRTTTRTQGQQLETKQVFNLPITGNPVVHVPNSFSPSEKFGRPEGEALLQLLLRYNEVLEYGVTGNKKQSRPTPVFYEMGTRQQVDDFIEAHGKTERIQHDDGTVEVDQYLEFDSDRAVTLGGNGKFKWESPGAFLKDTETLLQILFYLYVQHSEVPEFALGNAVSSSQASVDTQMEPLSKFITKKRALAELWIKEVLKIVIDYASISDTRLKIPEDIDLVWPDVTREDGSLTLKTIQWLYSKGMISRVRALKLSPVPIHHPDDAIKEAEEDLPKQYGTRVREDSGDFRNDTDPEVDQMIGEEETTES